MPFLLLALLLLLPLLVVVLLPFSLLQRYRVGTARRRARGWVATLNAAAFAGSTLLFLAGAMVTSLWVPPALTGALGGVAGGAGLALLGLRLTRWERSTGGLHYTPNRVLVLLLVLVVSGRMAYGAWRAWQAWDGSAETVAWAATTGLAGTLAAGGVVLGYSTVYWFGLWRRLRFGSRQ